jgi:hypothetical protein
MSRAELGNWMDTAREAVAHAFISLRAGGLIRT